MDLGIAQDLGAHVPDESPQEPVSTACEGFEQVIVEEALPPTAEPARRSIFGWLRAALEGFHNACVDANRRQGI